MVTRCLIICTRISIFIAYQQDHESHIHINDGYTREHKYTVMCFSKHNEEIDHNFSYIKAFLTFLNTTSSYLIVCCFERFQIVANFPFYMYGSCVFSIHMLYPVFIRRVQRFKWIVVNIDHPIVRAGLHYGDVNCTTSGDGTQAVAYTRLILGLHPANERRPYKVTPPLIGWVQA